MTPKRYIRIPEDDYMSPSELTAEIHGVSYGSRMGGESFPPLPNPPRERAENPDHEVSDFPF